MMKLIDTLRTVTAGKIYVENERARLTHRWILHWWVFMKSSEEGLTKPHRLAKIHEKDGKVEEAAKIMQELQVIHNTDVSRCHMCQLCAGGDVWLDGETGESGVDPWTDEALPSHPRLHQVGLLITLIEGTFYQLFNIYLFNLRAQIISKKISVRFFENQKYHELKLKFYGYMIEVIIKVKNQNWYKSKCSAWTTRAWLSGHLQTLSISSRYRVRQRGEA